MSDHFPTIEKCIRAYRADPNQIFTIPFVQDLFCEFFFLPSHLYRCDDEDQYRLYPSIGNILLVGRKLPHEQQMMSIFH